MAAAVPGSGAPRKRSELALRVVSSLVLAPVAIAAVYLGTPWFDLLIAVLAVLMAMEWARMAWGSAYMQPGFTIAIVLIASIREIFGNGTIFGAPLFGERFAPALGMVSPSGGFITLGLLIGLINKIVSLRQKKGAH